MLERLKEFTKWVGGVWPRRASSPICCAKPRSSTPQTHDSSLTILHSSFATPSAGDALRELDRARTPESKICVWSLSLDPIYSIGWLLSITVRLNPPAEGIIDPRYEWSILLGVGVRIFKIRPSQLLIG